MQNIFSHIAYLLTEHECVIIPDFGALVHHSVPALQEDVFSPPAISLGFNSDLKHNDGLLADAVKRERNISYNDANKIIVDFSAGLIRGLNKNKEIIIPQVGRFIFSEEQKINFFPAVDLSANASFFGFKTFSLPLLSEIEKVKTEDQKLIPEKQKNGNKDVIVFSLSKRFLTAASVAAVVGLFLLFSTPINNEHIPSQYASMFYPALTTETETNAVESTVVAMNPVVEIKTEAESTENKIEETSKINTELDKIQSVELLKQSSDTNYYIIIASFPTHSDAEKMLGKYKNEFGNASVLNKDGRSRVFVRVFQDKSEAGTFLKKFRADNPKYKEAWLLTSKENT